MTKQLHIISLDIPYPADYGGVIDIFYKIKALHAIGIEITLHCFQYGDRKPDQQLNAYCKEVFYYPRITGLKGLHVSLPYIVSSRRSESLLQNLLKNKAPILFEGIHSTQLAFHPALQDRQKLLRAHNVETDYYRQLAHHTRDVIKQVYYSFEANRLLVYESNLSVFSHILSISEHDEQYFKKKYPALQHAWIPAFHPNESVSIKTGKGSYCLYHGNLAVSENIKSVEFLLQEVFNKIDVPLIIAGKNPSKELLNLQQNQVRIVANPDTETMNDLIANAQIHVLPSFQQTGLKLKVLHALFQGRHCLLNDGSLESQLKACVYIAETPTSFCAKINELMSLDFTEHDVLQRSERLAIYDNHKQALRIADLLNITNIDHD